MGKVDDNKKQKKTYSVAGSFSVIYRKRIFQDNCR